MEAAFVDIGTPKNAVLYRGDVQYDAEDIVEKGGRSPASSRCCKAKQIILCQVTKNPIGAKGARLTQEVSLPGPVRRADPELARPTASPSACPTTSASACASILDQVKPAEHGVIVRTAAENVRRGGAARATSSACSTSGTQIEALAEAANAPDAALPRARHGRAGHPRGVQRRVPRRRHRRPAPLRGGPRLRRVDHPDLADRVEYYDAEAEGLPALRALPRPRAAAQGARPQGVAARRAAR